MRYPLIYLAASLLGPGAFAEIVEKPVEYRHGDTVLQGYFSFDNAREEKVPGVLVIPEWWGLGEHARERARQLAQLGYAALAVDMYGKDLLTKDPQMAMKWAKPFRDDRQLMRDRVQAALEVLRQQEQVDSGRIGAIGFCFGGTAVLELARGGADVDGVVSFHGGLGTPRPEDARRIQARVLVLHGADDPHVPAEEFEGFIREMREAKVDWQLNMYGGAVHSFTNPEAGDDPSKGAAYNKEASERAWNAMRNFFRDVFHEDEAAK